MKRQLTLFGLVLVASCGCSDGADGPMIGSVSEQGLALVTVSTAPNGAESDAAGSPGEWPRWLGPRGDGISRETGWNIDWKASAPKTLWKQNVGIGFSSMAVTAGRLFTMGHRDGQEHVYCLDAQTGDEVWTHSYRGKLLDNMHEGGPGATPTVDQDRVYTHGREGQLRCLRTDNGEVIWSIALQQELGIDLPEWGFSSSPLVVGDTLLVEAGRVVALNKFTGQKIWQTTKYHVGYGSPTAFTIENELLIAVLNNDCLLVLRAEDGSEVAKKKWETSYKTNSTTPIVSDGHIFISTGYNKGCALFRLAGNELDLVYTNKLMRNHFNNCVLWKGFLYGIDGQTSSSRNCKVVCMDWSTGEVRWTHRGLGTGSLFIADNKLVILGDQGQLVLAEADPSQYAELGSIQVLHGKCWTVPILAGGRIYCRNASGDVVCVDVRLEKKILE